jgi:PAS domain S-box-containing protein
MFGYEKESLERGFNILEVIAESDRARALEGLAARKAGEHGKPTEYLAVFEDGSTRPVLICSSPIFRSGVFSGVRGMIIDISERKRTERLEAQMEKYRAVADLSAGVAHNFNNMLQIIMGNAELARMKMETEAAPEIDRNLTEITDICKFASKTVKRLNRFAAHGPMVSKKNGPNLFKLEEVARKAIEMTEPLRADKIRSGQGQIEISESLEKDLDVAGSQTEALEVIFNLIQNSIEATPPSGGHIHVSGWRSPVSAYLRVSDTGIGIPAKDLERIFTPFYTSSPDIGRGLGLATSLKIVRDMGGQIEVESSPGQGSSFIVSLPLAKTPCGTSEPKDSTTSPHRSLNILAVDDSESILTILEKGLTKRGHNVRKALSGTEGLSIAFESQPNIILCDMAMPDMDGLDFCRSLNSHYMARDLKPPAIIILSGLPDIERLRPELQEQGARYILSKPVDFTELESILQKHSAD